MKEFFLISLFALVSCAAGPRVVTMDAFYDIPVGATKEEVISKAGTPYTITKKEEGVEEFEYIERMRAGARVLQERRYILTLKDGVVVSKRVEQSAPHPATFDSFDMQTTHNGESEN